MELPRSLCNDRGVPTLPYIRRSYVGLRRNFFGMVGRVRFGVSPRCSLPSATGLSASEPLVIFTDPGLDDAVFAQILSKAARDNKAQILAVVGQFGCASLQNTTEHAFRGYRWALDVPVIAGSARPLEFPHPIVGEKLPTYYAENGLCGGYFPELLGNPLANRPAVDVLAEILAAQQGKVRFVVLSPWTDAALFIDKHSKLAEQKISSMTIMAGAFAYGNSGPAFRIVRACFAFAPPLSHTMRSSWEHLGRCSALSSGG